jgi:ribosomal protein S18 acetylase RimI-like enzyme
MMTVRRLTPAEWPHAFPIIAQLRSLDEAEFLTRVKRQSYSGYELVGAFKDSVLIGVIGMRPVHTLTRGSHLHIDDLVVDTQLRGTGAGRLLLEYAEKDAKARDMTAMFLDARKEAIPFYEAQNFVYHTAPSMKKPI